MTSSRRARPQAALCGVLPIARGPIARRAAIGHTFSCGGRRRCRRCHFGYDITITSALVSRLRRWTSQNGRDAVCDGCKMHTLHYTLREDLTRLRPGNVAGRLVIYGMSRATYQLCPSSTKKLTLLNQLFFYFSCIQSWYIDATQMFRCHYIYTLSG